MKSLVLLAAVIVASNAAAIGGPSQNLEADVNIIQTPDVRIEDEADNHNIIVVPNNCPPGQQLINRQCRDVWQNEKNSKSAVSVPHNCRPPQQFINGRCRDVWVMSSPKNVVVVPNNCPPGQQFINGRCRDIWNQLITKEPLNVVTVPPNCPVGQQFINGQCRDVWEYLSNDLYNVVTVPPNCPPGQEFINGQCRDVWEYPTNDLYNVVTVPPNCPPGQEFINGKCRDVWIRQNDLSSDQLISKILATIQNSLKRKTREAFEDLNEEELEEMLLLTVTDDEINRNIISVPNQCPSGSRPDALGICRPTFD